MERLITDGEITILLPDQRYRPRYSSQKHLNGTDRWWSVYDEYELCHIVTTQYEVSENRSDINRWCRLLNEEYFLYIKQIAEYIKQ
jgi:hypothetical protein